MTRFREEKIANGHWDTNTFQSLFSCKFLNDLIISLVFLYWSCCTLVCVLVSFQGFLKIIIVAANSLFKVGMPNH